MDSSPKYPPQRKELLKTYQQATEMEVGFINEISRENPFRPLKKGDKVPEFTLNNHLGEPVEFKSLYEKGPLVLSFNRGNWCAFCRMELNTWKSFLSDLSYYSASLVSISADVTWKVHLVESLDNKDNLILLDDPSFKTADQFGLRYKMTEEYANAFESFGMDLSDFYGEPAKEDVHSIPVPATYVIGMDGVILYDYFNTDYTQRVEPFEIIKVLIENSKSYE